MDYTLHESVVANVLLCRDVIEDKDDLLTAVKIVDMVDYDDGAEEPAQFTAVLMAKSLNSTPDHTLEIHLVKASGERAVLKPDAPLQFGKGPESTAPCGLSHVMVITLAIPGPGVHWLEFWIDGKFATKTLLFFRRREPGRGQ